ncbi:MAG: hypothetical protein D6725_13170 [Planctomycetota bacterium]|nr:MAG: hypothetical protein D6725_13170 [Planctomycetota bacterium]
MLSGGGVIRRFGRGGLVGTGMLSGHRRGMLVGGYSAGEQAEGSSASGQQNAAEFAKAAGCAGDVGSQPQCGWLGSTKGKCSTHGKRCL